MKLDAKKGNARQDKLSKNGKEEKPPIVLTDLKWWVGRHARQVEH